MKLEFLPCETALAVRGPFEESGGLSGGRCLGDSLRYLFLYLCGGSMVVTRVDALISPP